MHVPPACSRSITATVRPAPARAVERGPPACPSPMIMASYRCDCAIVWSLLKKEPQAPSVQCDCRLIRSASSLLLIGAQGQQRCSRAVTEMARIHDLEVGSLNAVDEVERIVVPARIGDTSDEPRRPVVGQDHAVLLERGVEGAGLRSKMGGVDGGLQAHPQAH